MLYNPTKIAAFSRECYARGLAVVVVGFPATPIVLSRTRICVSAGQSASQFTTSFKGHHHPKLVRGDSGEEFAVLT